MKNKYLFVAVMLLVIMAAGVGMTTVYVRYEKGEQEKQVFRVVTSFYPMYIAAENIIGGCEGVDLSNLSEPQTGCMHDYQLTAADMKSLSSADVFVVNGGGIENFLSDVAARYPGLTMINACEQLNLLEDNAHAWMSITDYMVQVQTIADGLSRQDAGREGIYQENCKIYLKKLEALHQRQQEIIDNMKRTDPNGGENDDQDDQDDQNTNRNIVIFHEAFEYLARDLGLNVCGNMDLDEERQVSAGEAADIVAQIQENSAGLLLAEELYGKEMSEMVKKETGVTVIYLDTCVRGAYEADSYLNAMGNNLELLHRALY